MAIGSQRLLRAFTLAIVLLSVISVASSYASASNDYAGDFSGQIGDSEASASVENESTPVDENQARVANVTMGQVVVNASQVESGKLTVVATQGFYVSDERAELVAFTEDGDIAYYDDTYRVYFDVDPVEDEKYTVEYTASKHFNGTTCDSVRTQKCTRNLLNRVNLSTGETTTIYSELTSRIYSARWHDIDRLNDTHVVVADIVKDRVYIANTTSNEITWQWNASYDYSKESGGQAFDWTHINDVEVLADGRIMASLRNQDSVIFLDPSKPGREALQENWTLGEDDDHEILYEQHNPDYIPEARGGPAIIVADSENARIVEYHRENGSWESSWTWRDARLQWPRDADRLPNGNTLIVDSHGDRVVELGPQDNVVWTVDIGMPYDVERLGTGDESAGGPTADRRQAAASDARADGDTDKQTIERSTVDRVTADFWLTLKSVVPPLAANGLLYVSPSWVTFSDLAFAFLGLLAILFWLAGEFYYSGYSLRGLARRLRETGSRVRRRIGT